MTTTFARRLAAVIGFLGVALGAFGAHALKPHLFATGTVEMWDKAVLYQLLHAGALLGISAKPGVGKEAWFFVAGVALFSGSLYAFAVWRWSWLMALTPLGGVAFLVGWLWLALRRTDAV